MPTTYDDDVTETATAADADSALLVSPQIVEEFGAAAASQAATGSFILSVIEGATAASAQSAAATFARAVVEAASAADSLIAAQLAQVGALIVRGRIYDIPAPVEGLISNDPVAVTGLIT